MVKSRYHKKLKFGSKGRNTRNDGYPLDGELPTVCALALCTFEEFILVDLDTLLYKVEVIWNGKYTGFYTIATIEEKG